MGRTGVAAAAAGPGVLLSSLSVPLAVGATTGDAVAYSADTVALCD